MMFCPQCKGLMISSGGQLKCKKCGYIRDINASDQLKKTNRRVEKEITIVDAEKEIATLPTTTIKCPDCDCTTAYWWLRQLRAADESEVRFFRCTACGKTWREYD
jgi:DNA-directed RNA polymerase subunit M